MLFVPFTFLYANAAELGDVNGDGKITAADARQVLRYSALLSVDENFNPALADTDANGKIDAADARNIIRYVAKLTLDVKGTPATPTTMQTNNKNAVFAAYKNVIEANNSSLFINEYALYDINHDGTKELIMLITYHEDVTERPEFLLYSYNNDSNTIVQILRLPIGDGYSFLCVKNRTLYHCYASYNTAFIDELNYNSSYIVPHNIQYKTGLDSGGMISYLNNFGGDSLQYYYTNDLSGLASVFD